MGAQVSPLSPPWADTYVQENIIFYLSIMTYKPPIKIYCYNLIFKDFWVLLVRKKDRQHPVYWKWLGHVFQSSKSAEGGGLQYTFSQPTYGNLRMHILIPAIQRAKFAIYNAISLLFVRMYFIPI